MATLFAFGGDITSFIVSDGVSHALTLVGGATVEFWSAKTGGSKYTVYDDASSTNPGTSRATSNGLDGNNYGFLPAFYTAATKVYASANSGPRIKMISTDVEQTLFGGPRTVKIVTGVTGATTIDWSLGTTWDITLIGAATLSFVGFPASGVPVTLTLVVRQDATGGRTITWPTTIAWDDATLPIQNATASAADLYRFYTHDGGATTFGQQDGRSKAAAPTGSSIPYGILDLSKWYLGAPVDATGGVSGASLSIKRPQLETFSEPVYFHANVAHDGVVFSANCGGATTSGSGFPRSELREMEGSDGLTNAAWGFNDGKTHTLTCTFSIDELPLAKPEVVVGQVHDSGNVSPAVSSQDIVEIFGSGFHPTGAGDTVAVTETSTRPFALLYKFMGTSSGLPALVTGYTMGAKATYKIVCNGANRIEIFADLGLTATTSRAVITSGWPTSNPNDGLAGLYFKAGCYTQSNTSNATKTVPNGSCAGGASLTVPPAGSLDGGDAPTARATVTIYSLTHTHV